jgi:hypothetical protein
MGGLILEGSPQRAAGSTPIFLLLQTSNLPKG